MAGISIRNSGWTCPLIAMETKSEERNQVGGAPLPGRNTPAYADEAIFSVWGEAAQTPACECSRYLITPLVSCEHRRLLCSYCYNVPCSQAGYGFRKTGALTIVAAVTVTLLLSGLIATTAALAVRTTRPHSDYEDIPCCPDGWVGYQRQCYFFSEDERNWTASQSYCSSHGASLAGIDSGREMTFLLRYKGSIYHWIGLRREPSQPWKGPNGTEFDNRFEVRGGGDCAYLNDVGVSTSSCETEKNWICARPERHGKRKENSVEGTAKQ